MKLVSRYLRIAATIVLVAPLVLLIVAWTFGALYYTFPISALRTFAAWFFVVACLIALVLVKRKRRALAGILLAFLATLAWFLSIAPTNDRNWSLGLAVMPRAEFQGERVIVHDVRDFDYRTPEDFDVRYVDRTFELSRLRGVDMLYSYWDENKAVAHTMFSWDFGGADVLCLSVEVRHTAGSDYGAIPGLFKQFEILYVLADERDVVRLRTNYRGEQVYLIRSTLTPAESRQLLVGVLEQVNRLREAPEFYATIGNNCTTSVVRHVNALWPGRIPLGGKILMNGYAPEIAYANHLHQTDLPFDEWMRRAHINEVARAADRDPLFSRRIRSGRPGLDAVEK